MIHKPFEQDRLSGTSDLRIKAFSDSHGLQVMASIVHIDMAHHIPLQMRQRLTEIVLHSKSAVGQQAAEVYLTRISCKELIEDELGTGLCDESWTDSISNEFVDDTGSPSCPTPLSTCRETEEPRVMAEGSMPQYLSNQRAICSRV